MGTLFRKIERRDEQVLMVFNETIRCRAFDILMPVITYLGSLTFCVFFCIILFFIPNVMIHFLAVNTAAALILSGIAAQIIKVSVNRIRPYIRLTELNIKKIGIDKYSFPSGHTTAAFTTAVMISLFFPSITIPCVLLACLVGISRMYLGVHFPSDVLVGMILGVLCSFLIYLI